MTDIKTERCYYLDLAKVIATILVIFGHLYSADSSVRLHLYGFHMPFFFIVSGVFHKYCGKINWNHYIRTILWPILLFITLSIIASVLFYGRSLGDQLRFYFVGILTGNPRDIIWFLFALFWCKFYQDYFCSFRNKIIPSLIWAILLFVPVILLKKRLPFVMSQGMMAFPFYAAGYYGKRFFLDGKESFKWGVVFICCLVLTVLITRIQGRVSMMDVSFGHLGELFGNSRPGDLSIFTRAFLRIANIGLFYLNGFVGSGMILSLSLLPFPKTKIISSFSKALITVVGTQTIFITFITRYLGYNNDVLLSFGLSLTVFFLCFLLHQVLQPLYKIVR